MPAAHCVLKARVLLRLENQPEVLQFFKNNLCLISSLGVLKRDLERENSHVIKPCCVTHTRTKRIALSDRVSACHPGFVFHKAKRFFSETALNAAQDFAEAKAINLCSSEYVYRSIEVILKQNCSIESAT